METEWTLTPTEECTPQQANGYDCGVYTCLAADYIAAGETALRYTQAEMPYFRRRLAIRLIQGSLQREQKREALRASGEPVE